MAGQSTRYSWFFYVSDLFERSYKKKRASDDFRRGYFYLRRNDYLPALDHFTRAIEIAPDHYYFYITRGKTYAALKQHDKALGDFTSAIVLNPYKIEAYRAQIAIYSEQKDFTKIVEACSKYLTFRPGTFTMLTQL